MIKGYPFPRDGTFDKTVTYNYTKTQNKRTKANPELYKGSLQEIHLFYKQRTPLCKMTLRFVMIRTSEWTERMSDHESASK